MSTFDHLIINGGDNTYNGKALFRGAIMNSGCMVPVEPVTTPRAQEVFDTVVKNANCSEAADALACLRAAPYEPLLYAMTSVPGIIGYRGLDISYLPRPDPNDNFFALSPELSLNNLAFPRIPIMIGTPEIAIASDPLTTSSSGTDGSNDGRGLAIVGIHVDVICPLWNLFLVSHIT